MLYLNVSCHSILVWTIFESVACGSATIDFHHWFASLQQIAYFFLHLGQTVLF